MKKYYVVFALLLVLFAHINVYAFNTYEEGTTTSLRTEDTVYAETAEEEWEIFEARNPGIVDTGKMTVDGDARYRTTYDHQLKEYSQDYRIRLGFDLALDDQADLYIRLNTGTQQVGDLQQDNTIVDIASLTIAPNLFPGMELCLGKNELPFQTPSNSGLLFDTDIFRGEGITSRYFTVNDDRTLSAFATAGYFNNVMNGGQVGIQIGDKAYIVGAVGYYDFYEGNAYREAMAEIGYDTSSIYGDYTVTVGDNVVSWLAGTKLGIGDVIVDYNYREIDSKSIMSDIDFPFDNGHAISVTLPTGVRNLDLELTHYANWQCSQNQSIGALTYTF